MKYVYVYICLFYNTMRELYAICIPTHHLYYLQVASYTCRRPHFYEITYMYIHVIFTYGM